MLQKTVRIKTGIAGFCFLLALLNVSASGLEDNLKSLLPDISGWKQIEEPQFYYPESLFEYINGAAEIYLSYDFRKCAVAQYEGETGESNVSLEIYDMGSPVTAFGIYSAERFPDNHFIDIGTQGYMEEGTLNFLTGRYYVKMLCFDCGDNWDEYLTDFARRIEEKSGKENGFPPPVKAFPKKNLIQNSEKFILKNFMGYKYLNNGYQADYDLNGNEFTAFIIHGDDETDAEQMLGKYLESKKEPGAEKSDFGYHIKDKYYDNIYIAKVGSYLYGVMKIPDSRQDTGKTMMEKISENIKTQLTK